MTVSTDRSLALVSTDRSLALAAQRKAARPARGRDERGSMAVEVVVLIPVLFMFTLFVVAGGRYVSARADAVSVDRRANDRHLRLRAKCTNLRLRQHV